MNAIYLIKTIKKNEAYALSACRVSDIIDLTKNEIQLPCHEKLIQNICLKQITRKYYAIIQFRGKNAKASLENIQSTQKNKKQRRLSKFCFEIISPEFKSIFNYLIFQRRLFSEKSRPWTVSRAMSRESHVMQAAWRLLWPLLYNTKEVLEV